MNHATPPAGEQRENKMGVMPMGKLIVNMSLPIMAAMLVQALYNVVDSVFVSMISENALTAVSLAFPVQNLMIAVGVGTGVGINALLSRSLGEKNFDRARAAAVNGVFLAAVSFAVFAAAGALLSGPFYASQVHVTASTTAADAAQISRWGAQYVRICCCLAFGPFFGITFERLLQSTGRTFYAMLTQMLGAVVNIVMDPVMIFGLLGFPRLGVAGAALATVLGQFCGMLLGLFLCIRKNPEVPLRLRGFRPSGAVIREIYSVGLPSIIMQSIASVMTYGMNLILIAFSTTATAVFGVYFKLNSFIFMPVFGLNNGLVPIMAYNYGARREHRILRALRLGTLYALGIMAAGTVLFQIAPQWLLSLFNASRGMLTIGVPALRIISVSFVPAAFCIVCGALFQSLGNGFYSMIVSVTRQLLVLLPTAYALSLTGRLELVWLAFPAAEVASVLVTAFFFRRIRRDKLLPLEPPPDGC
jgi:putative MATE family efflux protein